MTVMGVLACSGQAQRDFSKLRGSHAPVYSIDRSD